MTAPTQGSHGPSKLYVSNLSKAATLTSMRELFGTCGDVLEVEFAAERGARGVPSAAYVTMASSSAADRALHDLHGRLHCDRVLVVTRVAGDSAPSRQGAPSPSRQPKASAANVAVTQQYRDRHALTYELTCSGKLLTLRFFFPIDDAHEWQLEARLVPGWTSPVTAGALTREKAFQALIDASADAGNGLDSSQLDWEGVATALRAVRGL